MPITRDDLIRWETEKDISKFAQILKYLDEDIFTNLRAYAIDALGRIRDSRGIGPLIMMLSNDVDEELQVRAKNILTSWPEHELIQELCRIARTEDYPDNIRYYTLRFMMNYPVQDVFYTYFLLLSKGYWRKAIARFIHEMDGAQNIIEFSRHPEPQIRFGAVQLFRSLSVDFPGLIEAIEHILNNDESPVVRAEIIAQIISQIEYDSENDEDSSPSTFLKNFIPSLISALKDEDFYVRELAAEALGGLQAHEAVEPLIQLLEDIYPSVQHKAIISLSKIPSEKGVDALIHLAIDRNKESNLRSMAIAALKATTNKRAFEPLVDLLRTEDNVDIQCEVIGALASLDPEVSVNVLVPLTHSDIEKLAKAASSALLRKGKSKFQINITKWLNGLDL